MGGWLCPSGSTTPFGQRYMTDTESVCPAGFGCLPGSPTENASMVACAPGFYCRAGSIDQQGRQGALSTCSSAVTLIVETEASAESRTLSGAVPESIRGHCSVNLNRTLVVLNSSDGYLCPRETLRSTPMLELDGRIVLAGVSTCTVAEQAKTAERAGAAALLVSPELISHDIPGARSGPAVARPCTPVLHERLAVGNLRWTVMQLSGTTTLPSAKAIASLSTPLATRHPLLRTAHRGASRRRRCAATNATGSRLASGTRGRQVVRGAFGFSFSMRRSPPWPPPRSRCVQNVYCMEALAPSMAWSS